MNLFNNEEDYCEECGSELAEYRVKVDAILCAQHYREASEFVLALQDCSNDEMPMTNLSAGLIDKLLGDET